MTETFAIIADANLAKLAAEGNGRATMTKALLLLSIAKADFGNTPIRDLTVPFGSDVHSQAGGQGQP